MTAAQLTIAVRRETWHLRQINDGVVMKNGSMPGLIGGTWAYGTGDAAVHEAGHWLGLYHTFQGGCSSPNDYVDDTPAEATASSGCSAGTDTCTGRKFPGLDPTDNYMDFGPDSCVAKFTAGQDARMASSWASYRR